MVAVVIIIGSSFIVPLPLHCTGMVVAWSLVFLRCCYAGVAVCTVSPPLFLVISSFFASSFPPASPPPLTLLLLLISSSLAAVFPPPSPPHSTLFAVLTSPWCPSPSTAGIPGLEYSLPVHGRGVLVGVGRVLVGCVSVMGASLLAFAFPPSLWFASLSSLAFESSSFLSLTVRQLGQRERGEKRATTNVMDRFRDALCRPPTSWVPPCVCPSPIPLSSECVSAHIPLERGGADAATFSLVRELRCC